MSAPCLHQWSWKFEKCVNCGTQKRTGGGKHHGKGICHNCYDKKRSQNPVRKVYMKVNHDNWWHGVRGTQAYKDYSNEKMKEWQRNNQAKHRANWKRRNRRKKYRKFILGTVRIDKTTKNGIIYFCDECNKRVETCINKNIEEGKQITQLNHFKRIHERLIHKTLL